MKYFIPLFVVLSCLSCSSKRDLSVQVTTFYFDYHALDYAYKDSIGNYPAENIGIDIKLVNNSSEELEIDLFSRDKENDTGCFIQLATFEDTILTWTITDKLKISPEKGEYVPFLVPYGEYPKLRKTIEEIGKGDFGLFLEMKVLFVCPDRPLQELSTDSMRTFIQFADTAFMVKPDGQIVPSL